MTVFADAVARERGSRRVRSREPALALLGRLVGRMLRFVDRVRTVALSLAGFGLLTAASWATFGRGAGMATAGLSLLILEFLSRGGEPR